MLRVLGFHDQQVSERITAFHKEKTRLQYNYCGYNDYNDVDGDDDGGGDGDDDDGGGDGDDDDGDRDDIYDSSDDDD